MTSAISDSPLTPLAFLERSGDVWGPRPAVVDGDRSWTYAEHYDRVRRGAAVLREELDVGRGARVAILMPNVVSMLDLHYAVPGVGAVLVPLNTRLTADDYAYILEHSEALTIIVDDGLADVARTAVETLGASYLRVVTTTEWEALVAATPPRDLRLPSDERALLSINYTSGTTARPKGVMTTHRGAYLSTLGVIAEAGLTTRSSYLWTLPVFHCNGWAYTWAVTAMGARHVCLPRVDPALIWAALSDGVTHACAAPTVVHMMLEAPQARPCPQPVQLFVGGSPPSPALLERAAQLNIEVTHLYGLTETYGPIAVCAWHPEWDALSNAERARMRARQGVATVVSGRLRVVDEHLNDVPRDGETLGEVVVRGNNVMVGYYKDPEATGTAFAGGWLHTGDLAVMHPDGYIELRDRAKDIVISGGENILTIEIEQVLAAHDSVAEAAVVGAPDEHWGECVVAYVTSRNDDVTCEELRAFARKRLARFKVPKRITIVDELPKTGTGKVQKFVLREWAARSSQPVAPAQRGLECP